MDIMNTLNQVASYLGATSGNDDVFIMDQTSFQQMFKNARPLKVTVHQPSKIMTHPLEDGSTITDHAIIEPATITIEMIFTKKYKDTIAQLKSCFDEGKLLTIVTKARAYSNMVLTDLSHVEDPDAIDVLNATLQFNEARFINTEYVEMTASELKNSNDASTINRGTQQPTPNNGSGQGGGQPRPSS